MEYDPSKKFYNLRWKSETDQNIWDILKLELDKVSEKLSFAVPIGLIIDANETFFHSIEAVQQLQGLFYQARTNAKQVGRLLACSLALGWPFRKQTVSLIGFSLGCQVMKSCLKMLH